MSNNALWAVFWVALAVMWHSCVSNGAPLIQVTL